MNPVAVIFRKEVMDILRDRRTLFMMVLMPMLITPLLIIGIAKFQKAQMDKELGKELRVAFLGRGSSPELFQAFASSGRMRLFEEFPADSIRSAIAAEELDAAVAVSADFTRALAEDRQGAVALFFKSSDGYGGTKSRLMEVLDGYERAVVAERVGRLRIDPDLFDAVAVQEVDVASMRETISKIAGGQLPYMFILFAFLGTMYPGIDMGAGEKERGTLETLLTMPVKRRDIVIGKLLVAAMAGVLSALIAIGGILVAVRNVEGIPPDILSVIFDLLGPKMIALFLSLTVPVAVFFAALILSLSIYARSFKEAQAIIGPANILIVVPVMMGLFPGVELNARTALVPILNVSLASKEILAGTIRPLFLAETYLSLFALAALAVWGCARWFDREETIFRS